MMVSHAIDPQMSAFLPGMDSAFLSCVHDELTAVWLDRKTSVRDRAQPRCGGYRPTKSIEVRLHEAAAAEFGAPADQAEKHLIRGGRQSSEAGYRTRVFR